MCVCVCVRACACACVCVSGLNSFSLVSLCFVFFSASFTPEQIARGFKLYADERDAIFFAPTAAQCMEWVRAISNIFHVKTRSSARLRDVGRRIVQSVRVRALPAVELSRARWFVRSIGRHGSLHCLVTKVAGLAGNLIFFKVTNFRVHELVCSFLPSLLLLFVCGCCSGQRQASTRMQLLRTSVWLFSSHAHLQRLQSSGGWVVCD